MNLLVIGGVAAGTKVAAKAKRVMPDAKVTIVTKGKDISYAGCGLPYYVGELIEGKDQLIVNTPAKFSALTGALVQTEREVTRLDVKEKKAVVRNLRTGGEEIYTYDACVIASGASSIVPPFTGVNLPGVFTMRTPDDAIESREYMKANQVKKAVVVGGGFIGLEVAENLLAQGVSVTVMDMAPQIMPGFDPEMADYAVRHLAKKGIRVLTSTMFKGTILVDEKLRTNVPDVYAAGDCAMVTNRLTGARQWSPMGSSANMEGRTLALALNGEEVSYPGVLGTGVVKLPGLNGGRTGLTEEAAKAAGYDVETVLSVTDDKAHYYPDYGQLYAC